MKVDIWSDIRCPFCYVGKKKFEKALSQFPNADKIEVQWHSFQLDPSLKTQVDLNSYEYFSKIKGVTVEEARSMFQHAANAGKEVDIEFNFANSKVANSYRGHLLLQLGNQKNVANELEELLFKAQFVESKNIDDLEVLKEIGAQVGLSPEDVEVAMSSDEFAHGVSQDGLMARQLGINSVPFFVFNNRYAISGAQQPELFLQILTKSWSEYDSSNQIQITKEGGSCDTDGNCN